MKKNKILLIFILLMLSIACMIFSYKYFSSDKEVKQEQIFNEQIPEMFAIMIEDENEEGNFIESTSNTWPAREEGYLFNEEKSMCVNSVGNIITSKFEQNLNNQVRVSGLKETAYCYVYFDYIDLEKFCEEKTEKLSDCIMMIENTSYNIDSAKDYIESKGSADTSKSAPSIIYQEISEETTDAYTASYDYYLGTSYTFNSSTGRYTIKNPVFDSLSDKYIDYYTCGVVTNCTTMYKIKAYEIRTDSISVVQAITKAIKYSQKKYDSFESETGLYATDDDFGRTYYYRGAVKNNYVSYAGFIWRIVRINGDGSIRMIYSGTNTDSTGDDATIGKSAFNNSVYDPRFIGYTYGENTTERISDTTTAYYKGFVQNVKYYFSKGYTKTEDGKYELDQDNLLFGTWEDVHDKVINEGYKYTCRKSYKNVSCDVLIQVESYHYVTPNYDPYRHTAKVKVHTTDNSVDYASTLANDKDSAIKLFINTWYENNILNKKDKNGNLLSSYLYDSNFCNDRSIYRGDGYMLSTYTFYKSLDRLQNNYEPSLKCPQDQDKFSVAAGNLKYPIALLTIDEAGLAGGKHQSVNDQYYLWTGASYWTMSPAVYSSEYFGSYMFHINEKGIKSLNQVSDKRGVRPVINLKANVNYIGGNGTKDNPYQISID